MVHFPLLHDSKRFYSQSVCCALLASLPLCLSESASGLSHVVKVDCQGSHLLHFSSKGWQEWPAGSAPGQQKQGQRRQEPGEEGEQTHSCLINSLHLSISCQGAQEGPKYPRPARPRPPPGPRCPRTSSSFYSSGSSPQMPLSYFSGFHGPPHPPARCPPCGPCSSCPPSFLPPPRAPRSS